MKLIVHHIRLLVPPPHPEKSYQSLQIKSISAMKEAIIKKPPRLEAK